MYIHYRLANGTLVNGKLIEKYVPQEISIGSSFILGDSKIVLKVLGLLNVLTIEKSNTQAVQYEMNDNIEERNNQDIKFLKEKRKKSTSRKNQKKDKK